MQLLTRMSPIDLTSKVALGEEGEEGTGHALPSSPAAWTEAASWQISLSIDILLRTFTRRLIISPVGIRGSSELLQLRILHVVALGSGRERKERTCSALAAIAKSALDFILECNYSGRPYQNTPSR